MPGISAVETIQLPYENIISAKRNIIRGCPLRDILIIWVLLPVFLFIIGRRRGIRVMCLGNVFFKILSVYDFDIPIFFRSPLRHQCRLYPRLQGQGLLCNPEFFMTSRLCSITMTVLPRSTSSFKT